MADIIQLLPDNIANQIAAGEVIQRPASVIKELLENAIDAGATSIKLIIKDAGKTSIQIIDDGKGMSETDARMAFERHATSKIRTANDLFSIKTMGFRGEALASIAAIAHVELITRQLNVDLGTRIVIEGTQIIKQEPVQAMPGTSLTIKNLFFNVPARRKFLKSDPVELKHILDEFHRVSLASPDVFLSLHHNGNEIYHLPKSNLRQRIVNVVGKQINDKLIPVSEETEIVNIQGFIGKAEGSRKTAGDQYIFVNGRFIKSPYLNHAIRTAYEDLITKEYSPVYFIFLEIDPASIDINVHPTKTEIKFEDERMIYNYLRVSLKHALGLYSLTPMLDFEKQPDFGTQYSTKNVGDRPNHDTQNTQHRSVPNEGMFQASPREKTSSGGWEQIYQGLHMVDESPTSSNDAQIIENEVWMTSLDESDASSSGMKSPIQLHNTYIIYTYKSGLIIIDQQAAHERILYEHYLERLENSEIYSQKELFPITVDLSPAKSSMLKTILPRVNALGFDMQEFGQHTFIIHGTPVGLDTSISVEMIIERVLDNYSQNLEFHLGIEDNIARSMAISSCIKRGRRLEKEEMINLTDQLFGCKMSSVSPSGKKCYTTIETETISKMF